MLQSKRFQVRLIYEFKTQGIVQPAFKRAWRTSMSSQTPDLIDALLHQELSVMDLFDAQIKIIWNPSVRFTSWAATITSMEQGSISCLGL
jgi:hypothetical protein